MRRVSFFVLFFSPNEQRAGGAGGALPDSFFFFPCSADHERDWPPCKVVFFGLATNALNVRNNNNKNRYALDLYSGIDILSSCFLCLVQDAPALRICRVFIATATVLPEVNPLEHDVFQSHAAASSVLLFFI